MHLGEEIESVRRAWETLGLGKLDGRSERALQNRIADGATPEQIHAAVKGAGDDDWLRRRAKVPFAVVFASLASLERFAHQGRKLLEPSPPTPLESPRAGREEVECPPPTTPDAPTAATAIADRGPPSKNPARARGADDAGRPPEAGEYGSGVAGLLNALSAGMRPRRNGDDTPADRRRLEQAEFDKRRLELVAALQTLQT
jgi:hypothetical protein